MTTRTIVRTWPMRGTLHFVPAEDARWMLALLAPRVIAGAVWKRRTRGSSVALEAFPFTTLTAVARESFARPAQRYARYLGSEVKIVWRA